ncbi:hypothetical protein [Acidithiobacillus sp.]|jgi:hypothetical protein|uniref:hypothetical protein n=1 Tax=Acidithiobacillus sp. TaxID=1872118 RepID=UPI0026327490|nr:hypothetical protein [Acidithiobacillus sp.]
MNLLGEPAPTFDDPIGLLRACHERILGHGEILPIAEGMLGTGKRASIGATMARRRQAQ